MVSQTMQGDDIGESQHDKTHLTDGHRVGHQEKTDSISVCSGKF